VSGESPDKAIKPEVVAEYRKLSDKGQLKFVVGPKDREWEEMESVIKQFKDVGVDYPIWVMPTGAREEEQTAGAGIVAEKAFKRGYNVAARVHVYLFGNAIGT
jgi:organic radical activating enzyme